MAKRKRRKKRKSWVERAYNAIEERKEFYTTRNNPREYKLIAEMVTDYLLRNHDERTQRLLFGEWLSHIKPALPHAIKRFRENKIPLLRDRPKGARNLRGISLHCNQPKKQRHFAMVDRDTKKFLDAKEKELEVIDPERVETYKITTRKLLGDGEDEAGTPVKK